MQVTVIGLGNFGLSLARALASHGVDVLAVDRDPERVRSVADFVAEALVLDATDADALARTAPEKRDVCVCGIGNESTEASIICTALLRQLGAPRIIARAANPLHARILSLVGAHRVVNPEDDFGVGFARQLAYSRLLAEMPLGDDLHISEIEVPELFAGRTLAELALPRRFSIMVIAVRSGPDGRVQLPDPATPLARGDVLVVVGAAASVARLLERS
jgi:trk system potassium uptake protein TrkA